MSFKGIDISLILTKLIENVVEVAAKTEGRKYIWLIFKYDRKDLW